MAPVANTPTHNLTLTTPMNSYYYLNENKEPQGPHTLDELRALMTTGKLRPETLAAPKGAATWIPLRELLTTPPMPQTVLPTMLPAMQSTAVGACPGCKHELTAQEGKLPERCPTCSYRLRAFNIHDLWQNFILALRKSFVLKGRAPRIEYWSFVLFSTIITSVLMTVMQIAVVALLPEESLAALNSPEIAGTPEELPASAAVALMIMGAAYFLINLALMIPQITVSVRRLHDVGRSGKWLLVFPLLVVFAIITATLTGALAPDNSSTALIGCGILLLVLLLIFAVSIFLFVLSLLDSQRGPNKYGPSPKYPLG